MFLQLCDYRTKNHVSDSKTAGQTAQFCTTCVDAQETTKWRIGRPRLQSNKQRKFIVRMFVYRRRNLILDQTKDNDQPLNPGESPEHKCVLLCSEIS